MIDTQQIWKTLEKVMDPEVDMSVVDLGLIYDVSVADDNHAHVAMTLTTERCPMSQTLTKNVEKAALGVSGVTASTVELVWDPPWNPRMISREDQEKLGRNTDAVKGWEKY